MPEHNNPSADLKRRLRIKYGLRAFPTDGEIVEWERQTRIYIENGKDPELAGREAAFIEFRGVDTVVLCSEADTIEALLKQASSK